MDKFESDILNNLSYLKLPFIRDHYDPMAKEAARKNWAHVRYFARLVEGEASFRQDRAIKRRIRQARFPVIKTLDQFQWNWPENINRLQIQDLFRLKLIDKKANVIFLGGVGVGNYVKRLLM